MYVQCERCKSEYDFDDALVSERGTTVKCTHCGHQFKVRRTVDAGAQDRWVVRAVSGQEVVFTSLRELQKAIMARQVGRQDSLARGGAPPRLLGAIAELEPFFDGRKGDEPTTPRAPTKSRPPPPRTPVPPPPARSRVDTMRPPVGGGVAVPPPAAAPSQSPLAQTMGNVNTGASALASTTAHMSAPQQQAVRPPAPSFHAYQPEPQIRAPEPPSEAPTVAQAPHPLAATMPQIDLSPLPPPTAPVRVPLPSYEDEVSANGRASLAEEVYAPPRRRMGGWVVAAVLLIGVGIIGFVVGKPYLTGSKPTTSALPPLDAKAQQFLSDGERAMLDGNLEAAKENFDKASVLADRDPRVLLDAAKLQVALADVPWLEVKLQAPGEAQRTAKQRLDEAVPKAKKAADDAYATSPDDPATVRVKIDALRIDGNLADARALVARIAGGAPQPDSAYVLAMLDLAEPSPPAQYTEILERLRLAAAGEGNLGRARAALVYALARSGDLSGARKELERLVALPRPHALLVPLRSFLDHAPAAADGGIATVDVNALPGTTAALPTGPSPTNAGGGGGGGMSGDPRVLLQQAEDAKGRGDLEKAKSLYGAVVAKNPHDSEALAGLGDIAEHQHDLANAKTYYQQALSSNGSFLPARMGLGNVLWESGDKAGGAKIYKEIVDSMPESAYPGWVRERSQYSAAAPAPTPAATPSTAPTESAQ